MQELALNILDISINSISAGATLVNIEVNADTNTDILLIKITDNGKGMSDEFIKSVTDPFATTRTTRKVGMGIPLFKMASEISGGNFSLESKVGEGTVIGATFKLSHIDRAPLGDLAQTLVTLIGCAPRTDFVLNYSLNGNSYVFDTKEVKSVLHDDNIGDAEIIVFLKDMIKENIEQINGGIII